MRRSRYLPSPGYGTRCRNRGVDHHSMTAAPNSERSGHRRDRRAEVAAHDLSRGAGSGQCIGVRGAGRAPPRQGGAAESITRKRDPRPGAARQQVHSGVLAPGPPAEAGVESGAGACSGPRRRSCWGTKDAHCHDYRPVSVEPREVCKESSWELRGSTARGIVEPLPGLSASDLQLACGALPQHYLLVQQSLWRFLSPRRPLWLGTSLTGMTLVRPLCSPGLRSSGDGCNGPRRRHGGEFSELDLRHEGQMI